MTTKKTTKPTPRPCPDCGGKRSRIVTELATKAGKVIRRERACSRCGRTFKA